jgi:hypothetical protein
MAVGKLLGVDECLNPVEAFAYFGRDGPDCVRVN